MSTDAQGTSTPQNSGSPENVVNAGTAPEAQTQQPTEQGQSTATTHTDVPEWAKSRFDRLTAQRNDAVRKSAELESQLRALQAASQAGTPGQTQPGQPVDAERIRADARREAQQEAFAAQQAQDFNARCNAAYEAGLKEFPDFDNRVQTLRMIVGDAAPVLFNAVTQFDQPQKLLAELASKPDIAERIVQMPPFQAAIELSKLASRVPANTVSSAPAPVSSVSQAAGTVSDGDPSKMTDAEWAVWRGQQLKGRRR